MCLLLLQLLVLLRRLGHRKKKKKHADTKQDGDLGRLATLYCVILSRCGQLLITQAVLWITRK